MRRLADVNSLSPDALDAAIDVLVQLWDDMECSRIDGGDYRDGENALWLAVRKHADLNAVVSARHAGMNGATPAQRYPPEANP